jgi:glycerol kinase
MNKQYILSIDQSTSGTKALLVDEQGVIIQKMSVQHKQYYPQASWVEHDPIEIYENVKKLLIEVVQATSISPNELKALAVTNQRETIVVWDKETGEPVYNAIVWQCRRTTRMCKELVEQGYEKKVKSKTGLPIDPYFSASKVRWILENVDGVKQRAEKGHLLMGTIDSWLIWNLTGGNIHATDYSNASRTLLFNIHSLQWDHELLEIFDIPKSMLADVKDSNAIFGTTTDEELPFSAIPITGVIGDSQGALFGQKCFQKGMAKATYGTGTSVLMHTGNLVDSKNGLVTSIAWGLNGKVSYALEGIINSTGDSIKWIKEDMGLVQDFEEIESAATSISDNEGVYFIPAFVGLGVPYWSPDTRAAILGMNRNTNKSHIVRAALESIAYQVKDAIELMQSESKIKVVELKVDGGATSNKFLMQFQADVLNNTIAASHVSELSAMGSVYLAGLGIGIWESTDEISKLNQGQEVFSSTMSDELRNKYYDEWKVAVRKVLVKQL